MRFEKVLEDITPISPKNGFILNKNISQKGLYFKVRINFSERRASYQFKVYEFRNWRAHLSIPVFSIIDEIVFYQTWGSKMYKFLNCHY